MSRARVAVLQVVSKQLTVTEAAGPVTIAWHLEREAYWRNQNREPGRRPSSPN